MAFAFPIVRSLSPVTLAAAAGMLGSIAAGQGVPCPTTCSDNVMKTICYEQGRVDNFAAPIDPLTPRPFFASLLSTYAISKPFDDARVNAVCGTSFQNLPCGIVSAVLEIKLRAENDIPQNDSIYLQWLGGTFAWASPINALPGAGGTWNAGQTQTFTLNLGTLPGGLISQMNSSGALDLLVSDDTTVDYARLTIRVCPCDGPTRVYTVGTVDNLAMPTEPTSRRPRLTALRTVSPFLWKDNDDPTNDRGWGHTFTGLPRGIVAADFTVRMKPAGYGAGNDGLAFDLLNQGAPETFSRGFNINTLAAPWLPSSNPLTNFYFDLGATMPTTVCGTNLLGDFGDGVFDVYIQDDTVIDAARLRVKPCPPMKRFHGLPYGVLGYAQVDTAADGSIRVVTASNGDGVSFDALGVDRQVFHIDPTVFAASLDGTEMTIGVTGPDFDGDGAPDVVIGGTATKQRGVTKLKAHRERNFGPLSFHVRDSITGETVSGTLQGDQAITVASQGLSGVEWNAAGDTIFEFDADCDMILPDGRRVRGHTVDLDDRDFDSSSVASCDWSWGLSQSGTSGPFGRIVSVSSSINGVLHTQTGSEATMSTNPGSITLSDILPGTTTGLDLLLPSVPRRGGGLPIVKRIGADITVACAGLPENCDDAFAMTAACRAKTSEAKLTIGAIKRRGSDGTSSGYSLRAGNCCRGHVIIMKLYDEQGNPTGERAIAPGTSFEALTTGKLTKADAGYATQPDGEFPWLSVGFDQDVIFLVDGSVARGRQMRLQSTDPAASDDGFEGLGLSFSGVGEVDVSNQRIEFEEPGYPCPADFNRDGGIDGDDIPAFFDAWEIGDASADTNQDGGVDGDDVTEFFRVWENGGC